MKLYEKLNRLKQDIREFCPPVPKPEPCTCGHDIAEHSLVPSLGGKCEHRGCDCQKWVAAMVNA